MGHTRMLDATDIADNLYSRSLRRVPDMMIVEPFVRQTLAGGRALLCRRGRQFHLLVPVADGGIDAYSGREEGNQYASTGRVRPVASEPVELEDACGIVAGYLGDRAQVSLIPVSDVEKKYLRR